jgi:hypothetical protein
MIPRPAAGILGMSAGEASGREVFASTQYLLFAGFDTAAISQCLVVGQVSWMRPPTFHIRRLSDIRAVLSSRRTFSVCVRAQFT